MGRRLLWSVLFTVSRSISTELTINFLFSFSLSFPALLLLLLQLLLLLLLLLLLQLLILLLILSLLRLMVQFFFVVKHFHRINFLEMAPYPVTSGFSSRSHLVASINTSCCCGCYHFGISPVHRLLVDLTALVITVLPALVACNLEYHHPFSSPTTCLSQRW